MGGKELHSPFFFLMIVLAVFQGVMSNIYHERYRRPTQSSDSSENVDAFGSLGLPSYPDMLGAQEQSGSPDILGAQEQFGSPDMLGAQEQSGSSVVTESPQLPVTTELPASSATVIPPQPFRCRQRGKFPVPNSCQDYHVCRSRDNKFFSYTAKCISGKIFDSETDSCRESSLVTSRPDCVSENPSISPDAVDEAGLIDGSLDDSNGVHEITAECDNIAEMIPKIIATSKGLCQHIVNIDKFVNKLKSGIDLRLSNSRDRVLNENVLNYNNALETSKNNVNVWRHGDDILRGIRRVFHSVKGYESEYDRKQGLIAERLRTAKFEVEFKRTETESKIKQLKADIKSLEETIKKLPPSSRQQLINHKKMKESRLKRSEKELEELSVTNAEFQELSSFLAMISDEGKGVENKAKTVKTKLDTWLGNLIVVNTALERHSAGIGKQVDSLQGDVKAFEASISKAGKEITQLDSEEKQLHSLIYRLDMKVDENIQKVKDFVFAMNEKQKEYNRQLLRICEPSNRYDQTMEGSNNNNETACPHSAVYLPPLDMTEETEERSQLFDNVRQQNYQIFDEMTAIMSQIAKNREDRNRREEYIEDCRRKRQRTQNVIFNLNISLEHQKNRRLAELPALSSIEALILGTQKVDCTFHAIHKLFDKMAAQANAAQSETWESEEVAHALKEEIVGKLSEFALSINQTGSEVMGIRNCI